MKRFIAGLILGLSVAAVPSIAEWDYGDMDVLKGIARSLSVLPKISVTLVKLHETEEWQARSLQRIVWVLERQYPAPAETPPKKGTK